ncbi:complement C1q-like protein 2 isoform X1 [Sinocyclocheilus grahami]|uniref:complement C1q-like protein 2 isoform X1 n=1 Tax=Sinocyclocheilus grahami TaxID=75366 RepID=UPI0007AD19F8|nr:PREDICTED: complement C1q-like protein 2 isoform X1 [Sinocyclocheilus grahami]
MLILITLVMLNVWVIPADEVLSPNINLLEVLEKITTMEKRMESMENEMERLKTENKAPKVAFSASLLSSFGPQSVGPFHNGLHTLIYEYVFLNIGDAYDPNTGIFTAPVRGAYAFRVFSKAFGSPERDVTAGLFKNDQHIISTHGHQASGFISSSNGVSLLLEEGDQMKVNLYPGQWIFDDGEHHHSTFSGHLLFPM